MKQKVGLAEYPSRDKTKMYYRLSFSPKIRNSKTGKLIRYKSLGIFKYTNPKTQAEKNHNEEISEILENELTEALIHIKNKNYDFIQPDAGEEDFLAYFKKIVDRKGKINSENDYKKWLLVYEDLKTFSPSIRFKDINRSFGNDFQIYLLNRENKRTKGATLSKNSVIVYFKKFMEVVKEAVKDDLLDQHIISKFQTIKGEDPERVFLSQEEVIRLIETPCKDEVTKKAVVFMAYTGLRISDIKKLNWSDIHLDDGFRYIQFQHQKTKDQQTLPLQEEAFEIIDTEDKTGLVFKGFKRRDRVLKQWAKDASIHKNMGYHVLRRTFATLLLNSDVSIYTLSKLMGHKNIKTTESYLKLLDKTKMDAVGKLNFKKKNDES